jgi:hypothetical protein
MLPAGTTQVWLRRGDGAPPRRVPVLTRSPRMDLALVGDGAGLLAAPPLCPLHVLTGDAIWTAGMPGIGPGVVTAVVEIPDAILPGFGRGFTARLGALMGYSGGPVVGPDGKLRGLVAALPDGGGSQILAQLTGMDLGGLAQGSGRRVFALSIQQVMEEAGRLRTLGA